MSNNTNKSNKSGLEGKQAGNEQRDYKYEYEYVFDVRQGFHVSVVNHDINFTLGELDAHKDPELMYKLYIEEDFSVGEIAAGLRMSIGTIQKWLKEHGMDDGANYAEELRNEKWMRERYVDEKKSSGWIAEELGVANGTVLTWLHRHDIEVRSGIQDPDHLNHIVRSNWELEIGELLKNNDIDYEYESVRIGYGDGRHYTPDFVTDNCIIEVKGWVREDGNEEMKARAAMDAYSSKEYIVVGETIPCDVHIPWSDREELLDVLNEIN